MLRSGSVSMFGWLLLLLAGCAGTREQPGAHDGDVDVDVPDARNTPANDAAASADSGPGDDEVDDLPLCDFMAPSFRPPGGLTPEQVPQFIVLGFDDNRYLDGFEWVLDTLEDRRNPPGDGDPRTYDDRPIRVTFYYTSDALTSGGPALLEQWRRAVDARHEVGNHTRTHEVSDWWSEIDQCNDDLVDQLGVDVHDIVGFRAPYLNYLQPTLLYPVLTTFDNIHYDCTIRHDPYYDYIDSGATDFYVHIWPYTLDQGADIYTAGNLALGAYPGLWELPCYTLPTSPERSAMMQPSSNFTGFDSTAYGTVGMSADSFLSSMKWALDFRLEAGDNRAPLLIGLHSDTYSEENTGYSQPLAARRQAVVDFIEYALAFPDVRFVSAKQLIQWMCNPTPL